MHETVILQKAEILQIPMFLGVFALDRLPDTQGKPGCFIMNHDRIDQPGSHWVALYVHPPPYNHYAEYFDSLGNKPPEELYAWKQKLEFNTKPVQSVLADTCGEHALYFLYLRLVLKLTLNETLQKINKLRNADKYVFDFVQKIKFKHKKSF